jgi:phage terminase Nu1 subunit (DNA packaging protein)
VNLSGSGSTGGTAGGDDEDEDSATGYWKSRARRERAEAELAELKLAELQGQLVRADDWAAALAKRAAAFREGLLQIPARLSAQLAAESDQARIHALLEDELRQVMSQLTGAT